MTYRLGVCYQHHAATLLYERQVLLAFKLRVTVIEKPLDLKAIQLPEMFKGQQAVRDISLNQLEGSKGKSSEKLEFIV
ncbi:hypothetical protein BRADI_1g21625v3 [Brachypodium distachyon]|uniref:Uncharacterized protein n=1 Tax=Brachypodium distachyon TaxID=15368 RepID=A0A2K2DKG5_BRADI|nr:hypothetical protein BRADI_1g21625v3 [Brachypodium distachyon]